MSSFKAAEVAGIHLLYGLLHNSILKTCLIISGLVSCIGLIFIKAEIARADGELNGIILVLWVSIIPKQLAGKLLSHIQY